MLTKILSIFSGNPIIAHSFRGRRLNWRMAAAIAMAFLSYFPACSVIIPYTLVSLIPETGGFFFENLDDAGRIIFYITAIFLLIIITLFAPTMSASAIAGERQHQTLDLLLITLLPARSVVLGKLISALVYTLFLIAAIWPIILFCLITGGVAIVELVVAFVLLVATSIAFTMIGLFMSSLGRTTTNATMLTYGIALPALFIAPPLIMLTITIVLNFLTNVGAQFERVVNFYGWGLVLSLNPLTAAIYSATLHAQDNRIILNSLTFASNTYYLLSPWFIYIIIYGLITWFLGQLTIQRLESMGRQ